ncbi:hypothetical protein B0T19DRAFT_187729 [Cercophora scortea]|uniref:Uncharacterized protein n=1 Tax=Cercophora scortea TaxID=314031 RepID=A0AAE0INV8_9PEZI|nr:hypothetical protein B0T19DRAFT_187729 [Cercophora scortea]
MQRSWATPTQPVTTSFSVSSLFGSNGGISSSSTNTSSGNGNNNPFNLAPSSSSKSPARSRPGTSSGLQGSASEPGLGPGPGPGIGLGLAPSGSWASTGAGASGAAGGGAGGSGSGGGASFATADDTSNSNNSPRQPNVLHKDRDRDRDRDRDPDRRPSFHSRKLSFSSSSPGKGKRRAFSSGNNNNTSSSAAAAGNGGALAADELIPPLPDFDFTLAAAAKLSRETETVQSPTLYVDSSFARMLSRTGTTPVNGFSSTSQLIPPPAVVQQSEASALHQHLQEMANKRISTLDYLRKAHEGRVYWFNTLLFDKPDLSRMAYFDNRKLARRATNYLLLGLSLPTVIDLNSSNPLEFLRSLNTLLSEFDAFQSLHSENGVSSSSLSRARIPQMFRRATGPGSKGRRSSNADGGYPLEPVESNSTLNGGSSGSLSGQGGGGGGGGGGGAGSPASVINFAASETDLLPGEEYTHLLTPSLPFDPDFFETFATLCDVLIDTYQRLLSLVPTPRECSGTVAELFTKADGKVRKIIVQGVVKEFEESSRAGVKTEVANIGKVVLGG